MSVSLCLCLLSITPLCLPWSFFRSASFSFVHFLDFALYFASHCLSLFFNTSREPLISSLQSHFFHPVSLPLLSNGEPSQYACSEEINLCIRLELSDLWGLLMPTISTKAANLVSVTIRPRNISACHLLFFHILLMTKR